MWDFSKYNFYKWFKLIEYYKERSFSIYAIARPKNYKVVYYINNTIMFFYLKLTKNHGIIFQIYYKQKNKTFNIDSYN